MLATVSRRAPRACQLQQQVQLRSKHVGSVTSVCELWREEVDTPATASRRAPFASQPRPRTKRVGFRYCARALAQGCRSAGG